MVAPSKIFIRPLNCCHCSQFALHPGIGCFRYFANNLFTHTIAGFKYFSPLLITPLILKYKSMNRELFGQIVKYYFQVVLWVSLATASIFFFVCCLRNMLGKFYPLTGLFVPCVLGMQFCWLFPRQILKTFTTATSQSVLEGILLQYSSKCTHLILHSPVVQTILFMLNSAIILHYKSKNIYRDFWFIQPHKKFNKTNETKNQGEETMNNEESKSDEKYTEKCDHTNVTCMKFLMDGTKSYIAYGLSLDLLAMLTRGKLAKHTQGFMQKIKGKFKVFRPYMTGFFISYVGIYRLSLFLLGKYCNHIHMDLQQVLSAFLGGISFIFVKRINFVSLSLVISAQILWQQFCDTKKNTKSNKKSNLVLTMLKNAPISQIVLPINIGYLVHNYIFNYHLVNTLARGYLDGLTCDKPKILRNTAINSDLQSLIDVARTYSIKRFL